jgi:hypothetical protein
VNQPTHRERAEDYLQRAEAALHTSPDHAAVVAALATGHAVLAHLDALALPEPGTGDVILDAARKLADELGSAPDFHTRAFAEAVQDHDQGITTGGRDDHAEPIIAGPDSGRGVINPPFAPGDADGSTQAVRNDLRAKLAGRGVDDPSVHEEIDALVASYQADYGVVLPPARVVTQITIAVLQERGWRAPVEGETSRVEWSWQHPKIGSREANVVTEEYARDKVAKFPDFEVIQRTVVDGPWTAVHAKDGERLATPPQGYGVHHAARMARLSGLPDLSSYEQGAEIEARMNRGELVQIGETWYERIEFDEPTPDTDIVGRRHHTGRLEVESDNSPWYVRILDESVHHTSEEAPALIDWTRDGRMIGVELLGAGGPLPTDETERPRRCPKLVPEGNVVTEGRQCQQYEGHAHDHTWYGDNGRAYSAWKATS